jgi:hypothetical protein
MKAKLLQDINILQRRKKEFSRPVPKKKEGIVDMLNEDGRSKWTREILKNIDRDRKRMISEIEGIELPLIEQARPSRKVNASSLRNSPIHSRSK